MTLCQLHMSSKCPEAFRCFGDRHLLGHVLPSSGSRAGQCTHYDFGVGPSACSHRQSPVSWHILTFFGGLGQGGNMRMCAGVFSSVALAALYYLLLVHWMKWLHDERRERTLWSRWVGDGLKQGQQGRKGKLGSFDTNKAMVVQSAKSAFSLFFTARSC